MKLPFFKNRRWSIGDLEPPWGTRKSIYWHIANHIEQDVLGLTTGGETLPDEDLVKGDNQFGWAPGAVDGVLGGEYQGSPAKRRVDDLYSAVLKLTEVSSTSNLERLYEILASDILVSGLIDQFIEKIINEPPADLDRLHTLARWLAMEAADREPVKFAIAMLGLFRDENDYELLTTLGRHEEFTLFVVVAIQNSEVDVENRLWKLAQHVRGWGRINVVQSLASTTDDYIKDWLVREGYRNDIMYEYTALTCAMTGELLSKLKTDDADDELIFSAGEILTAILGGSGPAAGYESYPDGAETYATYLKHLERRDNNVEALVFADRVERFLHDELGSADLSVELRQTWIDRHDEMLESISGIKKQPGWRDKILDQLDSDDNLRFWQATEAAKIVDIDPWDYFFKRIKRGEDFWWSALQTDRLDRIDLLIEHAEAAIPLHAIATGPSDDLGLGNEFAEHQKLDWLLQELRRFPGRGLPLIHAGLQSPVTRNRNMAARAIAEIPLAERSDEITHWLTAAVAVEPDADTKHLLETVIAGRKMED